MQLMKRRVAGPEIGEVFELNLAEGVAYLQLINRSDEYGDLIRVLPGTYRDKPDLEALAASGDDDFLTFFPLEAARRRGIVRPVGRFPVPKERRETPAGHRGTLAQRAVL
jgi:hypothetical protein